MMEVEKINPDCKTSALRMVRTEEGKKLRKLYEAHEIHHGFNEHRKAEPRTDGLCNTITSVVKDNLIMETIPVAMRGRYVENVTSQQLEIRADDICNALTTVQTDSMILEMKNGFKELPEQFKKFIYEINGELYLIRIRRLTPHEYWRLMGFSDEDFKKAESVNSNTQLYKQAGNSICKNVLVAIFGQMIPRKEERYKYLERKVIDKWS